MQESDKAEETQSRGYNLPEKVDENLKGRISEKSFGVEAQEHKILANNQQSEFYETNDYEKEQEAEFGKVEMESDSGNEREEVEDEKGGSVKESEKVEEEQEPPKASVESKASELISHGSTTAILDDLEQLIINLNHTAMEYLRNDSFAMSVRLLHKAEQDLMQVDEQVSNFKSNAESIGDQTFMKGAGLIHLESLKNRLLGLTYNNLGCVCKQNNDFKSALDYLKKALVYEAKQEEQEEDNGESVGCNTAGTILNICAILSKLNRHKQAQEYAKQATQKLHQSLNVLKKQIDIAKQKEALNEKPYQNAYGEMMEEEEDYSSEKAVSENKPSLKELQAQWVNNATTCVIAHYNQAVELEFMSEWKEALEEYQAAQSLSKLSMKNDNPMSRKIQEAINKIKVKVRNNVQLPKANGKKAGRSWIKNGDSVISYGITSNITKRSQTKGPVNLILTDFQSSQQSDARKSRQPIVSNTITTGMFENTPKISDKQYRTAQGGFFNNKTPRMQTLTTSLDDNNEVVNCNFEGMRLFNIDFQVSERKGNESNEPSLQAHSLRNGKKKKDNQPEQSPMSIRNIIEKLEKDNNPKRNVGTAGTFTYKAQQNPVLPVHTQRTTLQSQQNKQNSATQPGSFMLNDSNNYRDGATLFPSLTSPHSRADQRNQKNSARGNSVSGIRSTGTPSFVSAHKKAPRNVTNQIKRRNNAWSTIPNTFGDNEGDFDSLKNPRSTSNDPNSKNPLSSRGTHRTDINNYRPVLNGQRKLDPLNMSPRTMVAHLSIEEEKKLRDEELKYQQNQTKRDHDVNFFAHHIAKKSKKANKLQTVRQQSSKSPDRVFDSIAVKKLAVKHELQKVACTGMAAQAYLPPNMKRAVKRRQQVEQLNQMKKQNQIAQKEQQLTLNAQLDSAFQKQMTVWTEEKSEIMDIRVKEYEEQKQKDEEMRAELKRQQEERLRLEEEQRQREEEEKRQYEEEQRLLEEKRREEEERIQREVELAKAAGERAENASVQTEEQAMQARSVQQLKKGDGSEMGLNFQSKTSDFKIFNKEATEPDLKADNKDDKHAPHDSSNKIRIQVEESSVIQNEKSNSHKDQKSDHVLTASKEQIDEEVKIINNEKAASQEFIDSNAPKTGDEIKSETSVEEINKQKRINADSALEQIPNNSSIAHKSNKTKSSIGLPSDLDGERIQAPETQLGGQTILQSISQNEPMPDITGSYRESSVISGPSETLGTLQSQVHHNQQIFGPADDQALKIQESIVCEDDLASWKVYGQHSSRIRDSPDITDDNTEGMRTDIIGTGPIYIKKSTEYSSLKKKSRKAADNESDLTYMTLNAKTIQPKKKTKIHAIQELNPYVRQDSEVTAGTEQTYVHKRGAGPIVKQKSSIVPAKGAIRSFQTMIEAKRYSQQPDNVSIVSSQLTQMHDQYVSFRSPRGEKQSSSLEKNKRDSEEIKSTLTGNTYLVGGPKQKAKNLDSGPSKFAADYESHRSSMETVIALKTLPGHIEKGHRSPKKGSSPAKKRQQKTVSLAKKTNERAPQVQSMNKPPVAVLNSSTGVNHYMQPQNNTKKPRDIASINSSQAQSLMVSPPLFSPLSMGSQNEIGRNPGFEFQKQNSGQQKKQKANLGRIKLEQMRESPMPQTCMNEDLRIKNDTRMTGHTEQTMTVDQKQDRVAKIADKIAKLNIQLEKFQTDIDEHKNDPVLKSTHRSNASNKKLGSQKSGFTALTQPVVFGNEPGVKDARLFANLSSAPGTNRIKLREIGAVGTQPNVFHELNLCSQGLPTPTASIADGQTRGMNSAEGQREKAYGRESRTATQHGANEAYIREVANSYAVSAAQETEKLNDDGELSVEDILSVKQKETNSSM